MFADDALVNLEKEKDAKKGVTIRPDEEYKSVVRGKMLEVAFLKRASQHKYNKLMISIHDQHSFKKDVYPKSIPEVYELLENHSSARTGDTKKPPWRRGGGGRFGRGRGGRGRVGGMQLSQTTEVISGSDGRTIAHIKCFKCNKMGHYSDCCPNAV